MMHKLSSTLRQGMGSMLEFRMLIGEQIQIHAPRWERLVAIFSCRNGSVLHESRYRTAANLQSHWDQVELPHRVGQKS